MQAIDSCTEPAQRATADFLVTLAMHDPKRDGDLVEDTAEVASQSGHPGRGTYKLVSTMNATANPMTPVAAQPKKRCLRLIVSEPMSRFD